MLLLLLLSKSFMVLIYLLCFLGQKCSVQGRGGQVSGSWGLKLVWMEKWSVLFCYQTLDTYSDIIMMVDYCFLQGKTNNCCDNVFICFPFLVFCVVMIWFEWNCVFVLLLNHCFNLCLCRTSRFVYSRFFERKQTKKKNKWTFSFVLQTYNVLLLRSDEGAGLCSSSRVSQLCHFNMCSEHCQRPQRADTRLTLHPISYVVHYFWPEPYG